MKRRDETPDRCRPLYHTDGMKLGHFLENLVLSAGKKIKSNGRHVTSVSAVHQEKAIE